jgi:hypothetical protein
MRNQDRPEAVELDFKIKEPGGKWNGYVVNTGKLRLSRTIRVAA